MSERATLTINARHDGSFSDYIREIGKAGLPRGVTVSSVGQEDVNIANRISHLIRTTDIGRFYSLVMSARSRSSGRVSHVFWMVVL